VSANDPGVGMDVEIATSDMARARGAGDLARGNFDPATAIVCRGSFRPAVDFGAHM
jgi:hypothetical protein